jgi:hypothetical protein
MSSEGCWTTSTNELIRLFGDAIRALIPIAERAHMAWREPAAYDDWDGICEAIYRSIVIMSIQYSEGVGSFLPLPDYDRRIRCYDQNSFVGGKWSGENAAFVCFETTVAPFDTCLFAVLDQKLNVVAQKRIPVTDVEFVLVRRQHEKHPAFFDALSVEL